ncbi:DUF2812 domain-containing protein [Radiobacillus sp. PE A8.2]|uniref:DUF2812 domain-containing protein n=1 Tax=Radiobacillus sp. PE A8.2 TaxID=3380349 RepID=UPI00388E031E
MIKKVFKPFWSYEVDKTEQWLTSMAEQGYHLVKIHLKSRQFIFEKGNPKHVTYRITYDKSQVNSLPTALENEGWQQVFYDKNWQITRNENSINQIERYPIRDGIFKRNRTIMHIFAAILAYMVFTSLLPIFFSVLMLITGGTIEIEGSPFWVLTIAVAVSCWTIVPYSVYKLYKFNKRINGTNINQIATRSNERQLKGTDEMIVKRRIGWIYSPDKLEKWLEEMELAGNHLVRIGKLGVSFHFLKGSPRKVSYCADYQNSLTQSYFDLHKQAGWQPVFTSNALLNKWTIWSKTYESSEEVPQLYSDPYHLLKHAKRVTITHISIFSPLIIMYVYVILSSINLERSYDQPVMTFDWFTLIIFGLVIIEFGTFVIKSFLYYVRVKQSVNN